MKRSKNYYDKLHPEFNFLSDKNLRDQTSRIEENKIVMETEYGTITTSTSENMSTNEDNCLESSNIESTSDSIIIPTIILLGESQKMSLEILRPIFEPNYEIVKNQNIDQRVYPKKCNKSVTDDVIKVIDFLASNTLKEIHEPSYFDINALLYTSAVTAKEHLNDLKEIPKQSFKKAPQKWFNSIKSKITALRKKPGQLITLTDCKNTGNFTKHEKEIK